MLHLESTSFLVDYLRFHHGIETLSDIRWQHAVNSRNELDRCLEDNRIMCIETDIILSDEGVPIAAHPPLSTSDLTLKSMLQAAKHAKKGIKLDFKVWPVVPLALEVLRQESLMQPLILNANILTGNGAEQSVIPAVDFINLCTVKQPSAILSVGWRTAPGMPYTREDVDQMLSLVNDLDIVWFPIRLSLARASWPAIVRLLSQDKPGWAFSFWNTKSEPPSSAIVSWLRHELPASRATYDLIDVNENSLGWE